MILQAPGHFHPLDSMYLLDHIQHPAPDWSGGGGEEEKIHDLLQLLGVIRQEQTQEEVQGKAERLPEDHHHVRHRHLRVPDDRDPSDGDHCPPRTLQSHSPAPGLRGEF